MSKFEYLTAPIASKKMPPSIPYILANETAERFAFYGVNTILIVFMTKHLLGADGKLNTMTEDQAKFYFHLFKMVVYLLPCFGALLADIWLGKFKTIIFFSAVYCFGFVGLALDQTRVGLFVGLSLIALGTGLIKACVTANVGDQFGESNKHLIQRVFSWFYFAINFGAAATGLLAPVLLKRYGPKTAFAVPGVLMFIAFACYWLGRKKLVHIPAGGIKFIKESISIEGLKALGKLSIIYFLFIAMFWSLFDQSASAWVLQAEKMDLNWLGIKWLAPQIQAVNAIFVLILIPAFAYGLYPAVNKIVRVSPLRKISTGFFIASLSFVAIALIQENIDQGQVPSIAWQVLAYFVLTSAEVMISVTVIEFSYTQAPINMKSFVSSLNLLSISVGNAFTAGVNKFIQNPDGSSKLEGANYYWFFTAAMLVTAIIFIVVAVLYKEKTYIQDEKPVPAEFPDE